MTITEIKDSALQELIDDYCRDYLPSYLDPEDFKHTITYLKDSANMLNEAYAFKGWYLVIYSSRNIWEYISIGLLLDPPLMKEMIVFLLVNNLIYAYVQKANSSMSRKYIISSCSTSQDLVELMNEDSQESGRRIRYKPDDFEKISV